MALKCREEIVGKRFLSVSSSGCSKLKIGKIREWGWRSGVIRAASHRDNSNKDLQVLVEYDNVEWQRREWLSVYNSSFQFFLVEQGLSWFERKDPFPNTHQSTTVLWPALTFSTLVSSFELPPHLRPIEFLYDRQLTFKDYDKLKPKPDQDWEETLPKKEEYVELRNCVRRWREQQDGQKILLTTPSVLVGYRVEVYRSQGTTQWYTAVIIGYNETTRDLTVTDDTVLEEHNVDPAVVQMRLIGDGVVESIMRGENVGITPRRSRSAATVLQAQQHHNHHQPATATSRVVGRGITPSSVSSGQLTTGAAKRPAPPRVRKRTSLSEPTLGGSTPDRDSSDKGYRTVRKRKQIHKEPSNSKSRSSNNSNDNSNDFNEEDLENKQIRKKNACNRVVAKKKVLEEANNSKLKDVQVRIEDCLRNSPSCLSALLKKSNPKEGDSSPKEEINSDTSVVECVTSTAELVKVVAAPSDEDGRNSGANLVPEGAKKEEDKNDDGADSSSNNSSSSDVAQCALPVVQEEGAVLVESAVIEEEEEDDDCVIVTPSVTTVNQNKQKEVEEERKNNTENSPSRVAVNPQPPTPTTVAGPGPGERTGPSYGDDDGPLSSSSPFNRMDLADTTHASFLRFPDDRSDSGVSSLRSSSSDERSGSRSSALSSSDEPTTTVPPPSSSSVNNPPPPAVLNNSSVTTSNHHLQQQPQQHQHHQLLHHHQQVPPPPPSSAPPARSPLFAPSSSANSSSTPSVEPVRVWRDPSLLLESEPHVRHIHSVQHQSLLMSHPSASAASGPPPPTSASAAAASSHPAASLYPPVPPPTLMSPHHPLQPHHPHSPHPHLAPPPPSLYQHHVTEMLWKQRYPLPVGTHLLAPQAAAAAHPVAEDLLERERYAQDRLLREQRQNQEAAREQLEKQQKEREQKERERQERDKLEREKQEKEREQERERQEKQRVDQAVHKHFEESLRRASQKRDQGSWNLILPPPQRSSSEEERKRTEQELQQREQQRHLALRPDMRDRAYYTPTAQRPPSIPSKAEYPPPAHSRISGSKSTDKLSVHSSVPRAEVNMFGYPAYQPQNAFFSHEQPKNKQPQSGGLVVSKSGSSVDRDREVLSNQASVMSELKNSVIVKHDGKSQHHLEPKVSIAHSPSPKMRTADIMGHYLSQATAQSHKSSLYEYRSPTQSPHHLQHTPSPHSHLEPQNLGKTSHQRPPGQTPSPHHQRQSPHPHSQPHPSPETHRYRGTSESAIIYPSVGKTSVSSNFAYLPTVTTIPNYSSNNTSSNINSKSKVSSPAPHHIYGKPSAGIGSNISAVRAHEASAPSNPIPLTAKPPIGSCVSPSPFQQVPQYHPPHQQTTSVSSCLPPPAHSSRLNVDSRYDRMYPGGVVPGSLSARASIQLHGTSPPTAASAPSPISRPQMQYSLAGVTYSSGAQAVQTQPLDLGVSSNKYESAVSPKRKASTPVSTSNNGGAVCLEVKKRRIDQVQQPQQEQQQQQPQHQQPQQQQQQPQPPPPQPLQQQQPQQNNFPIYIGNTQPQLARVSEPSPLIASAATTITTVVNTAAYKPPATTTPPVTTVDHIVLSESLPDVSVTAVSMPSETSKPFLENVQPLTTTTNGTTAPTSISPAPTITTQAPLNPEPTSNTPPAKPSTAPPSVDSEKSNSPGPTKMTNYPVRHLKKAWLQRHTGEDTEDTTGVTGGGSCVTLPLNINNANPSKEPCVPLLHNIGSMAVNSINKSKTSGGKSANKKTKEGSTVNGHPTDVAKGDDSSSSDQEKWKKTPFKKFTARKQIGGLFIRKPTQKKGKTIYQLVPASESGSDSEKESGSEKDSDSGASTSVVPTAKKTPPNSVIGKGKEPKKRGRRPKSSKNDKGEEPRPKKTKEENTVPPRDPFRKPPVGQLKKTGESFLQDGPCFEVAPKLAKCRECRWTPNQRSKNMPNIFCRFYAFRRLRYTKNGQLAIAGFSDPYKDASEDDLKLWLPSSDNPPADLDLEKSRFLLKQVGDHFCDLLIQEKEAQAEHMSEEKTIAWKRVVQGVREMCDVCETTLFNFHWACGKCGFVVCLDCYKSRKNGTVKIWGETSQKDRDDFSWLLCTNRQPHEQEKLMLTQIIAGDSLQKLGKLVHEMRELWNIEQYCACTLSKEVQQKSNGARKEIIKSILMGELNGIKKEIKEEPENKSLVNGGNVKEEKTSPLSWLADVALSNEVKKEHDDTSSDSDEGGNFSTLRELLIRPSHKQNGSRATSPVSNSNSKTKKTMSRIDTLDDVISSVIEDSVPKNNEIGLEVKPELKHFVRRYNKQAKGRKPLPIRIMTLTESKVLYPDIPHSWLCDGRLLRLIDPTHSGNYKIFQDQWKRGQPVIVSDVTRQLNKDLWNPEAFARDFGDEKNDLVNCMNGNLVPNQPMRKFWEGFEHFSKRLKDERGNPMLLKLKDWPPGEDFAEMLPSRFSDLMKVLPLSEYTHRTGKLNLASRLPDCFVRPDLGPKMYNAYGSALHPTKGTTNLHLDISDAVNVMVYVGIPKDGDSEEYIKEAFRAIDEAGCDILTRRRVRDKGELPGALWHIYNARDADKIRDLLNKVVVEKGGRLEPHHDPIHDQSCYLDGPLRERLYKEYGVEGYAIVQCLGDAVFIPAGAPHQVRNLHNCIKVAEDFVSPENVAHCFHLTQEFRELSDSHSNHEDKLQIKNIIYHAVKDSLSTLTSILNKHMGKLEKEGNEHNGNNSKGGESISSSASSENT